MYNFPPRFDQIVGLRIRHPPMLNEVSQHKGDRSGDARQAMNKNIGSRQTVVDERSSLLEVLADIEGFVVVSGHVEGVGNVTFGMGDVDSLGGGQYSLDLMFYISVSILWRVLMFWAASRLPMKSPPRPACGSTMQEQSSGQTWVSFCAYIAQQFIIRAFYFLFGFTPHHTDIIGQFMGNDSQPPLRLASQSSLDFHSHARHPIHGRVSVYTCRSLPMTFLMRLDRQSTHSRLYHLFQQVQDLESPALLTLYGFHIQRTPHCSTCPSRDLTTEYWQYLNYSLAQHIRDRHRRHAPLTPHEIWHTVQTVLEGALILQRVGLIWQVNPHQLVVTPQGKLKCSWSHLQANNGHLRYFQVLGEYYPDLKECSPLESNSEHEDTQGESCEFLSPEEKWLLSEKERTSRINLEKCNSYKFGLLLAYVITLKQPASPVPSHTLEHLYAEIESKYSPKLVDILRGTLEVDPCKRWSLSMVESYCMDEFNPEYELLISEGRREELQEFNVQAQLKAENNKSNRRIHQGSIHSAIQSGQLQSGMRVNSQQGRQIASTESSCDQRLLQLREYRRTMMRSRQN